jgi:hypothetical protein
MTERRTYPKVSVHLRNPHEYGARTGCRELAYVRGVDSIAGPRHPKHAVTSTFDDYIDRACFTAFWRNDEFNTAIATVATCNSLVKVCDIAASVEEH